jgi:hypothetical protein
MQGHGKELGNVQGLKQIAGIPNGGLLLLADHRGANDRQIDHQEQEERAKEGQHRHGSFV